MDLNLIISNFIKGKRGLNVPQSEIDEALFIAYNVCLAKSFDDLERNVSEEEIQKLSERIGEFQKNGNWREAENLLKERLGENLSEGIYGNFAQNMDCFLRQL